MYLCLLSDPGQSGTASVRNIVLPEFGTALVRNIVLSDPGTASVRNIVLSELGTASVRNVVLSELGTASVRNIVLSELGTASVRNIVIQGLCVVLCSAMCTSKFYVIIDFMRHTLGLQNPMNNSTGRLTDISNRITVKLYTQIMNFNNADIPFPPPPYLSFSVCHHT